MLRRLGIQISDPSNEHFGSEYLASRSIGGGKSAFGRASGSRGDRRWGRRQQPPDFDLNSDTIENSDHEILEKPAVCKETYMSWETPKTLLNVP
jgi:hypothetical protein